MPTTDEEFTPSLSAEEFTAGVHAAAAEYLRKHLAGFKFLEGQSFDATTARLITLLDELLTEADRHRGSLSQRVRGLEPQRPSTTTVIDGRASVVALEAWLTEHEALRVPDIAAAALAELKRLSGTAPDVLAKERHVEA